MSDRTCTHQPCTCPVKEGEIYCSDACKEAVAMKAGDAVKCGCDHDGCKGHD